MRNVRGVLRPMSLLCGAGVLQSARRVVILMYHRVTGDMDLEFDLPFATFRQQMEFLAAMGGVVSLDEAMAGLTAGWQGAAVRYVISFDDAYRDFYTSALPLLETLALPATLYVPTGFLEKPSAPPIARVKADKSKLPPVSWSMLEQIAKSELITIGAHTHTHQDLPQLDDREVLNDVERCDELLEDRLGIRAQHFAYPRGVWDERVRKLVAPRYRTVVRADGGAIGPGYFDPTSLPRIAIHRSDGMRWFHHRIAGRLALEERVISMGKRLMPPNKAH